MLTWQPIVFIVLRILIYAWPVANDSAKSADMRHELFVLGLHNHSEMAIELWQEYRYKPDSYCWHCMTMLRGSHCPFLKLLFHSLLALPVYNLIIILIGWRLSRSTFHSAEQIVLDLQPTARSQPPPAPPTPAAVQMPPPIPPPRSKRRLAPNPPPTLDPTDNYPKQMNPFSTLQRCSNESDHYKHLRQNLKRALEGLQQPLPLSLSLPLPLTLPLSQPTSHLIDETIQYPLRDSNQSSQDKAKSRKLFHTILKRVGKPFTKSSKHNQIKEQAGGGGGGGVLQPILHRLKLRSHRKSITVDSSPSSSINSMSSNCSSKCLYVH